MDTSVVFFLFTMGLSESFKLGNDIILHFKKIILADLWRMKSKKWKQVLLAWTKTVAVEMI